MNEFYLFPTIRRYFYTEVLDFVKQRDSNRANYITSFYRKNDRYNAAIAYLLLCLAVGKSTVQLIKGINQKPYLLVDDKIKYISITHTDGMVAIVVSNENVGIDCELTDKIDDVVINETFSKGEQNQAASLENLRGLFWTAKESLSKLLNEDYYSTVQTELVFENNNLVDLKHENIRFGFSQFENLSVCIASESQKHWIPHIVSKQDVLKLIRSK